MAKKISDKLAHIFYDEILKLNRKDLCSLIKQCKAMTQTNCSWIPYWFKDVFIKFAKDRLAYLKRVSHSKTKAQNGR